VSGLGCGANNTANANVNWGTVNAGPQWIYWSTSATWADYKTAGPYAANVSSASVSGLPMNATIYLMVGTVVGGQLWPGTTITFSTAINCANFAVAGQIPWQVLFAIGNSCNNAAFFRDHHGHFDHKGDFHDYHDKHDHNGDWDWNDWNGWWNNQWQWQGPQAINWFGHGQWDPNWGNFASGHFNGQWYGNWAGPWPGTWNGAINGPWNGSWPSEWPWPGNWNGSWVGGAPFGGIPFFGCQGIFGHDFFLPAHFKGHGDFDKHDHDHDGHDHDHDHDDHDGHDHEDEI
jgi:hypothetical protein